MANQPIKSYSNCVIQCPEKGFAYRKLERCFVCAYYGGLVGATAEGEQINEGEPTDTVVVCKRPITRRVQMILED